MEGEGDLSVDGAGALDEAAGKASDDELGWSFQGCGDRRGGGREGGEEVRLLGDEDGG
jgi:hypothetical protein